MAFQFFMKRPTDEKKVESKKWKGKDKKINQENKQEAKIPDLSFGSEPDGSSLRVEDKLTVRDDKNTDSVKQDIKEIEVKGDQIYAFIDASNLFWGGRESIGFKIDYRKLLRFLSDKFGVTKAYYYGGLRIFEFDYSVLDNKPLDLTAAEEYLKNLESTAEEKDKLVIQKSLNKINFYRLLESYGYVMKIKPAKVFYAEDDDEQQFPLLKANCDVDMTFDMMRYMQQYSGVVAMTGDGDFASVLSYLKAHDRTVKIVSRWDRTASEIRQIAGDDFIDFEKLKHQINLRY